MIEGEGLAAFVVQILPEFGPTLHANWEKWGCDDRMIYQMTDGLRIFVEELWSSALPPYREDVFKRFFWLVDTLLDDGHPNVRDCVVLEIVQPAPHVWSTYFGPTARSFVQTT